MDAAILAPSRIESAQSLSGVGDGEVGRPPPGSPLAGSPVTRNAEIDPVTLRLTQGIMTPRLR
jgi:hypothetical protein